VLAVVDAGPLYAAVDLDDDDHERCVAALEAPGVRLIIPALVVAEASYLVATRLGAAIEAEFLRGLESLDVQSPLPEEWPRIAELVKRYGNLPLGAADASVVVLAERLKTDLVISLDRRHLSAVRPRHVRALRLLP
jgi:predicted nucleic acid-binding protein